MKKYLFILASLIFLSACGANENDEDAQLRELQAQIEEAQKKLNDLENTTSNIQSSSEESIIISEDITDSDVSSDLNADDSTNEYLSAEDSSSEENVTAKKEGYTEDEAVDMFRNYLIANNYPVDGAEISAMYMNEEIYVDAFKDNDTESLHPILVGNGRMDPMTGHGYFHSYIIDGEIEVDYSQYSH